MKRARLLVMPMLSAALAWAFARPGVAAAPIRYECEVRERATGDVMNLEFTLDVNSRDAFLVANNGTAKVIAHRGEYGITFLEPLPTGAVQTTTIAHTGAAMNSRHSLLPDGKFSPRQFEGFCLVE